jgi:hypothetical protein
MRRAKIKSGKGTLILSDVQSSDRALVYVLIANRKFKYRHGRSSVAYIGTTNRGLKRICESVAFRADEILSKHGVRKIEVKFFSCGGRQKVKMWRKLEHAMLFTFRSIYGEVPDCNAQGKGITEGDVFDYFSRDGVRSLVQRLG